MSPPQADSARKRTDDHDSIDASHPEVIGDYKILREIGRGGMGVVYHAEHRTRGSGVALKMIRAGQSTPEARRCFRTEIEAVGAVLDHPNIVPIYEVGEHEGHPYYTMRLCEGSLDDRLSGYRDPVAAAALIEKVARAVHHAHEHGVLHRDLKPANILLDHQGEPYVSDFGAAKRIGGQPQQAQGAESSVVIGTPMYMAPERARRSNQGCTTALDVYSLGVILYQLITGKLPLEGDSRTGMPSVRETEPVRPRVLVPKVPRDLETICLKCLEKAPGSRYRSAEELASDLERFRRGKPIEARPASRSGRAWRFVRRHPFSVGTILLLAIVAVTAVTVARVQEQELQRDALRMNAYAAHALAGAVAFHLGEQINAVVATASDPAVVQLLHDVDHEALVQRRSGTRFESFTLFDRTGTAISNVSAAGTNNIGKGYAWRDYFLGAQRLGEAGHRAGYISRVIQSESDDLHKFGIAAPIYDEGKWAGVLLVTIGNDFALKRKRLDHASDAGPMAVVVAPRDRSRETVEGAGDYLVILHEGLAHGAAVEIDSPRLRELRVPRTEPKQLRWIDPERITDDAHRDPVPGFEGRWLAGFAPVGDTGFVVIVQTRYDAAVKPNARVWRIAQVGGGILVSVVLGIGLSGYVRRRRRIPAVSL